MGFCCKLIATRTASRKMADFHQCCHLRCQFLWIDLRRHYYHSSFKFRVDLTPALEHSIASPDPIVRMVLRWQCIDLQIVKQSC